MVPYLLSTLGSAFVTDPGVLQYPRKRAAGDQENHRRAPVCNHTCREPDYAILLHVGENARCWEWSHEHTCMPPVADHLLVWSQITATMSCMPKAILCWYFQPNDEELWLSWLAD